jgi:hypothetical protein
MEPGRGRIPERNNSQERYSTTDELSRSLEVEMAYIAQNAFFEVPVRWFEIPMSSHRRSFLQSGNETPSVPQATHDDNANGRPPGDTPQEAKPTAGNRNGPGLLLDERA